MIRHTSINPDSENPVSRIYFSSPDAPTCFFTSRYAGDMGKNNITVNRERGNVLERIGAENVYVLNQIHSRRIFNTDDLKNGELSKGDGLYTYRKESIPSVTVADCMPVYFYEKKLKAFGVLHSGWKGTGIASDMVTLLEKQGGDINSFEFILGPSIGPCCYEVDKERATLFRNLWGSETVSIREGRYYLDMKTANINILTDKGAGEITVIDNCTCCSDNFYSFRGDGEKHYGLMLALIGYFG